MKGLLIGAITLVGFLGLTSERAGAQTVVGEGTSAVLSTKLGNNDVLDMVKAGLPEEVVVAKIQGSPCNFDTSPSALSSLKYAQVPNAIILAMVKRSTQANTGDDRDASFFYTRPGGPSAAPEPAKMTAQQSSKGCLSVKPIGSHVIRNMLILGALPGALISHQQYQVVDAVDYPARVGQKYHGNDLQTIQGNGTKVVLLAKHYTAEDLHMACHQ